MGIPPQFESTIATFVSSQLLVLWDVLLHRDERQQEHRPADKTTREGEHEDDDDTTS